MMISEVTALRKAGDLEEALRIALEEFKENDSSINKYSLGWVYYDFCKRAVVENDLDTFLQYVQALKDLRFSIEEVLITDQLLWQYVKFFAQLRKTGKIALIDVLYESLKGMYFTMPSKAFSALAEQLHKAYKDREEYLEVITDVMPFLCAEDFAPKSYQGILIMPLAEQIYIAYSRRILESGDKEIIATFIPILHQWMQAHPEYNSLIYYYVEMCNFANIPM